MLDFYLKLFLKEVFKGNIICLLSIMLFLSIRILHGNSFVKDYVIQRYHLMLWRHMFTAMFSTDIKCVDALLRCTLLHYCSKMKFDRIGQCLLLYCYNIALFGQTLFFVMNYEKESCNIFLRWGQATAYLFCILLNRVNTRA